MALFVMAKLPFESMNYKKNSSQTARLGFTFLEIILYLGITSVVLLSILQIGQNFIVSNVKAERQRSISENGRLAFHQLTLKIRGADDVTVGSSTFNIHPGVLTLDYPGSGTDVIFDTYLKSVTLNNGTSVTLRKLRMKDGGASYQDVTNDEVDVTRFVVRNLTQSTEPKNIQIELTLQTLNTTGDPDYDLVLPLETAISLRK